MQDGIQQGARGLDVRAEGVPLRVINGLGHVALVQKLLQAQWLGDVENIPVLVDPGREEGLRLETWCCLRRFREEEWPAACIGTLKAREALRAKTFSGVATKPSSGRGSTGGGQCQALYRKRAIQFKHFRHWISVFRSNGRLSTRRFYKPSSNPPCLYRL